MYEKWDMEGKEVWFAGTMKKKKFVFLKETVLSTKSLAPKNIKHLFDIVKRQVSHQSQLGAKIKGRDKGEH